MKSPINEIYFETYGCTANKNSSEIMKGLVKQAGLNLTSNIDFADLIVFNTCIVKTPTQEKIRRKIQDLLKNPKFKNKKIVVAGCMPRLNQDLEIFQNNRVFLLDTSRSKEIVHLIYDIETNQYSQNYKNYLQKRNEIKADLPKISNEKLIGITQISEGCLGNCNYCVVRLAKGTLFSYPEEKIIESIKKDLQAGCKEIWVTSQDNASYGLDFEEKQHKLPELLRKILSIKGRFKIRLGMMNPNNVLPILDQLVELYKDKKMFKFLHLPIQSGSNKVLKDMNRKYSVEDFFKITNKFKKEIPDLIFSTDVIVGYPTETEKDFKETLESIKKLQPEILNKSNFQARPKTPAEKLKPLKTKIIRERATKLSKLHLEICNKIQKPFLGKELQVLVDQKGWPNTYLARTDSYKLVVIPSKDKSIFGKKLRVKTKKIMPHYLVGEVVD